jgi:electron transfer flavoprotein beta subunit
MHSIVCIKQVPDTTEVRIDPETNTLMREGVPSIVNPFDLHAVEAALRIRDEYGGKITVISMGPPQAEEALRKVVTLGVDEAILLSDRSFAGSDTLATSYILSQAIRKIEERQPVDLVFCGKQAIDGDTAQVGPGIATRLKIPLVTYVTEIDSIDTEKKEIHLKRSVENGRSALKVNYPALVTVIKELNDVRYASMPNMIKGTKFKARVWDKDYIGAKVECMGLKGSPTAVRKIFSPPTREGGEIIPHGTEHPDVAAFNLVEKLIQQKMI